MCGDWLLHHDNEPAHSSNFVQQFLSKHSIALLRQPPYSPDIAPCDFWLFPKLKKPLKGQRFDYKTTVENNVTRELKAIPNSEFPDCFENWKHRCNRVIQSSRDYFEGCQSGDIKVGSILSGQTSYISHTQVYTWEYTARSFSSKVLKIIFISSFYLPPRLSYLI